MTCSRTTPAGRRPSSRCGRQRNGQTLAVVGLLGAEPDADCWPAVRDSVLSLVTVAVERSINERRLAHQATHDPLTGVGNRATLLDRLTLVLAHASGSSGAVAVLFCDLDGFKAVNNHYGHDRGDRLLVEVAERIGRGRPPRTRCVGPVATSSSSCARTSPTGSGPHDRRAGSHDDRSRAR